MKEIHSALRAAVDEIRDGTFFWRVWEEGRESRESIFGSAPKKCMSPAWVNFTAAVESSVILED